MNRKIAVVVCATAVAIARHAAAQIEPPVQTPAQQACIKAINNAARNVGEKQASLALACLTAAAKGTLTGSAHTCLVTDDGDKIADKMAKTEAAAASKCAEPPTIVPSDAQLANTGARVARRRGITDLLGPDLDAAVEPCAAEAAACKCQQAVAKAAEKMSSVTWKTFVDCKKKVVEAGARRSEDIAGCVGDEATPGSIAADAKGKIERATAKMARSIERKCDAAGVTSEAFARGACGSLSGAALAACIERRVACRACQGINDVDALSVDCDAFDDGADNDSCLDTSCTCEGSCLDLIDGPFPAMADEQAGTICATACQPRTDATPECGDCGGSCDVREVCAQGSCQCHVGRAMCVPAFPTTPPCALVAEAHRSSCRFMHGGAEGSPPYRNTVLNVVGDQDTDVFFYINFRSLYPAGAAHKPYVAECDASRGTFLLPGDNTQHQYFDGDGKITDMAGLSASTQRQARCEEPTFKPLPNSADIFHEGYYFKFTPNPGEHGQGVGKMTFVVEYPVPATPTETFEVVHVIIDIRPSVP
ncbi:MAG TPA: hypothetical protein VEC57_06455 [Candidatus Limnocylindrales bacterium]|nr:hypothetical protein [Candidatus Limnocylindrales bacterium]